MQVQIPTVLRQVPWNDGCGCDAFVVLLACSILNPRLLRIYSRQFFLCTATTEWLDGKHVVFGKVVEGMDVVTAVEKVGSESGKTSKSVVVSASGQL